MLLVSNINDPGVTSWISRDGGKTWGDNVLPGDNSKSDPACVIGRIGGTDGRFFINYLQQVLTQGASYKNALGDPWNPVVVQGPTEEGTDKNHLWIDNSTTSAFPNRLYCAFSDISQLSHLRLKFSTDNGASWRGEGGVPGPPIVVDAGLPAGKDFRGANIQTGPAPAGNVYATWTIRTVPGYSIPLPVGGLSHFPASGS